MPIKYLNRNNTGQANPAGPGSWTTGFNYALNNYAISYGNGYFVATGDGFIARSSNANTWEYKINTSNGVRGVAYGNGLWVAVTGGTGNTGVLYTSSNDGVSWTNLYQPANNYRRGVAYGNSVWVIICDSRSSDKRIFTSTDGSTWTARDSGVIYNSFGVTNTISFGGGTFVLVCSSGSSGNTTLCFTSSDGINWTERTLPASTSWKSSAYGNGVWVAVGSGHAARSTDNGATWSSISGRSGTGVTYGDGYFVIAGDSPAYSTDGINWTTISSGPPANSNLTNHIAYGNGIFASVKDTSSSNISTSPMSYIYSQVSPIKFINRNNSGTPTPTGNSVLFNGSNQYLSVTNTGLFGSGNWTFECWINAPVGQTDKPIIETRNSAGGAGSSTGFTVTMITPTEIRLWCGSQRIRATANYVNQWLHIAVVKNNTTTTMYFNGVSVGTTTLGDMSDTSFIVGAGYYGEAYINAYGNFYTSNMRVVKGSAVYTAAFTPSTSPLTAIANTSLLTCNAPTIVDASSNNFTITNNNSATVSSTTPFTVATAASAVKMKKVYSDPVTYMIATGGDLITTSGSYKIHKFTTVGTSSFVVSTSGTVPTIGVLTVAGGGGGAGYRYGVSWGGGGGGGGVTEVSELTVGANTYSVIVGGGGVRGSYAADGGNGEQSSFGATLVTASGGFGGKSPPNGSNGGTSGNGFLGGTASGGGGGGGAAQTGFTAGPGGNGATSSLSGTITYYGGGGGGGTGGSLGPGGLGGGGSNNGTAGGGTDGTPNTGGGGANTGGDPGGNQFGHAGGSGIVIIKYRYTG